MIDLVMDNFFVIEHPLFARGGHLHPMVEMCAARVIALFNELESTYRSDHVLVKKILQRFIGLQIDDARVSNLGGKRAYEVLRFWSNAIHDEFQDNNNHRLVSNNSGTNTALLTGFMLRS